MPIVCGIHPVLEALAAGSRTIERVVVTKGVRNKRILEVIRRASERGVPLRFEPREALDRAADGERHQGVLAIVAEKGLLNLEDLLKTARTPALLVLLDGVEDPRNMGAIIRSVDAAGADGVILPDRHTASLSDAASRTAAGALESVKIARIGNVVQALETLKAKGLWIVGFDGTGKERWDAIDYKRPIVLVLGGEGKGIRRLVKEHCDHVVSLPVFGQVSSLNVSVAAGIALYEAVRQRGTVPTLARPIPPRVLAAKKRVVIGPPPEDREEDPGARRRAAAIASLALAPEPQRTTAAPPGVTENAPASTDAPAPAASAAPQSAESEDPESRVREASLEAVGPEDDARPAEGDGASHLTDADADAEDDDDRDDDDVDDDDDSATEDGDEEDEEGDEDDDDGEEDGDEADRDDEEDDENEDADEDDEDDAESDDDEESDEDDEDDQGDATSDLATPFMPEDNSGGGEVTWGSEKELHAHRPRREGERRPSHGGGRRSGRPNDRKKANPEPKAAVPPGDRSQTPRPPGQPPSAVRDLNRKKRDKNRRRSGRGPDRGQAPRSSPESGGGASRIDRAPAPPSNGASSEGGVPPVPGDRTSETADRRPDQRPPGQGPEEGRPPQGRRRNRRRRGRGRNDVAGRPAGESSAVPVPPRDLEPPREGNQPRDRESRPQGDAPAGPPRPQGEPGVRENVGAGGSGRRDRDRRRRRRGRRGNGGPGGQGGGSDRGGSGGGSDQGGSNGGGGSNPGAGGGDGGSGSGGGSAGPE